MTCQVLNGCPRIWAVERGLTPDAVYAGARLGCLEMLRGGTTTFADQYFHMDRVAEAVQEAGLRAVLAKGILERGNRKRAEKALQTSADFIRRWNGGADGRITCKVGPHALYTCSTPILLEALRLADTLGVGLHMHLAESPFELKLVRGEKRGDTPVSHASGLGLLRPGTLAAHCVFVNDADIALLRETGTGVAHCPTAMMKAGGWLAPLPKLLAAGVRVGIGTDGCASNNNLDMLEETRTAVLVHCFKTKDGTAVSTRAAIRLATIGGAAALGLADEIGSLEIGKRADIILIDFHRPHLTPVHNVPGHLVFSAFGSDVHTAIVDGQVVMENGRVLTVNEDEVLDTAQDEFEALLQRSGWTPTVDGPQAGLSTALRVRLMGSAMRVMQVLGGLKESEPEEEPWPGAVDAERG